MAIKATFRAPAPLWHADMHWYQEVPSSQRERFARRFCARTFITENGNTGVVCSYPRLVKVNQDSIRTRSGTKRVKKVVVRVYDLDGAGFHWMTLEEVSMATKGRTTEERDFQRNAILESLYCDEAADIANRLEEV